MANNPQLSLQRLLVDEVGMEQAKRVVQEWKALGIDMGNGNTIHRLAEHNEILLSMISLSNFGITTKILKILETINQEQ